NTSPVLTISEMEGFIEKGGMINFITEESKVRFEINDSAAKKSGLQISSKLLSLAKKVIMEKDVKKSGNLGDNFDYGTQIAQLVKYMPGN
ncbi:MAG: YfiR family protein, partial [Planctomycetota bacterium]|nr:YfiR family protein [Planctomycetota bacterium]